MKLLKTQGKILLWKSHAYSREHTATFLPCDFPYSVTAVLQFADSPTDGELLEVGDGRWVGSLVTGL